jgi:hypothetical protein
MTLPERIPLYFNYVGAFPGLLSKAVASITHPRIEVRVNNKDKPVPFTKCLNEILAAVETPCYFFMHYDAEVLDNSIFDKMIEAYERDTDKTATVSACDITDLLILFNTEKMRELGGWDEGFMNSYMELDLRMRVHKIGYLQPVLYPSVCPPEMSHKDSSTLRNNTIEGNIAAVYNESFRKDIMHYYTKYPDLIKPTTYNGWVDNKLGF